MCKHTLFAQKIYSLYYIVHLYKLQFDKRNFFQKIDLATPPAPPLPSPTSIIRQDDSHLHSTILK